MAKAPGKHHHTSAPAGRLSSLSPTVQDLLCIVFLYVVTLVLFRGIIFDNAAFAAGGDTANAISYAHAGITLSEAEHTDILWMPYFFSGMPTFGPVAFLPHDVNYVQKYVQQILNLLYLNGRWTWYIIYFLLGGIAMFFLLRVLKLSRPAALVAALTFMLSPYAMGLPSEGHGSKLMAISYLPLVFLLTHLLFERRTVLMFGLLSAAIGTLLLTNHMQIVYYEFIIIGLYLLYTVIMDFPAAKLAAVQKTLLLVGALLVGLCISSYIYLSVYEYSQFSMRGGGTAGSSGGLAYDYATNWSWSPWEVIVLLIPGFYGIAGAQSPYYWGFVEPWTNANVYVGLVPVVLMIFALRFRRTGFTIFMSLIALLLVLVSFGRNFRFVYDAMFSYLPFFNKFRSPEMTLHLLPFALGVLAACGYAGIEGLAKNVKDSAGLIRTLLIIAGTAAAVLLLSLLLKSTMQEFLSSFLFLKDGEAAQFHRQYGARAQDALAQVKQLRFDILWKDYIKFLLLFVAAIGIIAFFLKKKVSAALFAAVIIGLLIVDLGSIDSRLINPQPANVEQAFRTDPTIQYLKQQPGLFRVFPVGRDHAGQDLFMDNTFAYFGLSSIGGYSPAKLKIYQTLLDSCLYRGVDPSFPLNMAVLNMLNVRYIVASGRLPEDRFRLVNADDQRHLLTYENPGALPRVFFADTAITASTDGATFRAMNDPGFNPARTAVLYETLPDPIGRVDSMHAPSILSYQSREITVAAEAPGTSLLVLSEVYYPAGWKAYIDGKETKIHRTNYILRSVVVPSGKHQVSFIFDPPLYRAGWTLSNAAWGIAGICCIFGLLRLPALRRRMNARTESAPPGAHV